MNAIDQTELLRALPYARRYARALTGARDSGDALVAAALSAPLPEVPARLALYAAVARAVPAAPSDTGLDTLRRNLLLLTALEDLTLGDAAIILDIDRAVAEREVEAVGGALALVLPRFLEREDDLHLQILGDLADIVAEVPGHLLDDYRPVRFAAER